MHRHISAATADLLNRQLVELYAQLNVENVKRMVLSIIDRVIRVDIATVDQVHANGSVQMTTYPETERGRVDGAAHLLPTYLHEHPVMPAFRRRDTTPARLTDLMPLQKYQSIGLYNEVYRPFGVLYQMNSMPPGDDLKHAALTLHRSGLDFSEEDRTVLGLLAPHFAQAYGNALAHEASSRRLELLERALKAQRSEAVFLGEGMPEFQSEHVSGLFEKYFPHEPQRGGLPEVVFQWLHARRMARRDILASCQEPFRVTNDGGSLEVRLLADAEGCEMLLLREQRSILATEGLASIGFTRRETEIFRWLAEGKTDYELGVILGISEHTAHKHVQHILRKLGVSSRATALLRVWELLGRGV
jgi:DNA-binding CsgD family transcriptional regulator